MRILQQCIYFPPEVGGLESHAYYLCRELVRLGHHVTMVTSRSRPGLPRRETMDGIEVVRKWFPQKRTPVGWAAHTLGTRWHYVRLARHADVLHAQTFASALPGMAARRKFGKPLVLTLHTSHFLRLAKRPAWRPVLRKIIRSSDWLLAASEEIRDVALGLYPHPRAEALTNGVDTTLFHPIRKENGRGRPRVVVPRRLFEKNGVEFFIRALPLLRGRMAVDALLVGDGPERGRLEALASELGVTDMLTFMGSRRNDEMPGILAGADVAVFPSLMEATSVAALEAMSCGLPVAASRVGGLPEIVDETVGTLFEPADPGALASALAALLERPDLKAAGRLARSRVVDNWSVERLARRHVEIYETLVREKR
ncbi:MAG TPA: glycosyltransferase family 4 protein [Longimicrobiales bacterium]|nr:glycosyltransferase family 4 protein [Longimicrobiales bacterium]